ncbi:hypothetical protein CJU90_1276 [Yarrowia sp. C11]|nr:hypothetical protein CKK34_0002 [Yarrowia sp. E02]KAG5371263.1 hypothetical protein CJU90_1276 [Yarrowia sp. C11]
MPRALEEEITETITLSHNFTLSPATIKTAEKLEFDDISRHIVTYIFRKRHDKVLPRKFVEELGQREPKRMRKLASEEEKLAEEGKLVEEARDVAEENYVEKENLVRGTSLEEQNLMKEQEQNHEATLVHKQMIPEERAEIKNSDVKKLQGEAEVTQKAEKDRKRSVEEPAKKQAEGGELDSEAEDKGLTEDVGQNLTEAEHVEAESKIHVGVPEGAGRHTQAEEAESARRSAAIKATQAEQAREALAAFAAEKKRLAEEAERERLADKAAEEQRLAIEAYDRARAKAEDQSHGEVETSDSSGDSDLSGVDVEMTAAEEAAENLRIQEEWRRREAERQKEIESILAAERKEKAAKKSEAATKAKAEARTKTEAKAKAVADGTITEENPAAPESEEELPPTNNPITAFLRTVKLALNPKK